MMKSDTMRDCWKVVGRSLVLGSTVAVGIAHAAVCDARSYGAKADGQTKDTAAIQKAIDTCAGQGGGTVRLYGGTFLGAFGGR